MFKPLNMYCTRITTPPKKGILLLITPLKIGSFIINDTTKNRNLRFNNKININIQF